MNLTFQSILASLSFLKETPGHFSKFGYSSKRQMRRARGKWKQARQLRTVFFYEPPPFYPACTPPASS